LLSNRQETPKLPIGQSASQKEFQQVQDTFHYQENMTVLSEYKVRFFFNFSNIDSVYFRVVKNKYREDNYEEL
jgi:hypothetical protein